MDLRLGPEPGSKPGVPNAFGIDRQEGALAYDHPKQVLRVACRKCNVEHEKRQVVERRRKEAEVVGASTGQGRLTC